MQTKWPWLERKFSFDFPAEKMPDIIVERLQGTALRIRALIGDCDPSILQNQPDGTWSIHENVGHLLGLEPLWIGRIDDILCHETTMREADLTNTATALANHHGTPIAQLVERFEQQRYRLIGQVAEFPTERWSMGSLHPRLKQSMRVFDICYLSRNMTTIIWPACDG